MAEARAFLFEASDAATSAAWNRDAAAMAGKPPRVTRGDPQRCVCDLCGRPGLWRHRVTLAHLVAVPPIGIPALSLLSANSCGKCAVRVREGDESLIETLKASRRQRVRDRVLGELLRVAPCGGEA